MNIFINSFVLLFSSMLLFFPECDKRSGVPPSSMQERPENAMYVYTLKGSSTISSYDEAMTVACIQGILNRNGIHLYVLSNALNKLSYWLNKFTAKGWLAGKKQIPVPVFRMLGSDPIRQYDSELGTNGQGVVTLEPVYKYGGGDSSWVNWYFKEFIEGKCMEYAYVQAGQENSFTWDAMSKGFEIQMPLIAHLRDEKKLKVETLAEPGQWFRKHYKITPETSVTVNKDIDGSNRKTVWFDSRFYRINLLWENRTLRFRDVHLFDENFSENYLTKRDISSKFSLFTLPFVDGNFWSSPEKLQDYGLSVW